MANDYTSQGRDKLQAYLERTTDGRAPGTPDVKPRPVATLNQKLARRLNWSLLQMRGAQATLSMVHHTWGHPALRTALGAIDEAIEAMEQYNATERLLQERFEAALTPGAAGSDIVESWVDGDHTASVRRQRRPGARSEYRVVGFNGVVQPEKYARVSAARRGLSEYALSRFRDPVRFPRTGDLWFHPDFGMHCVRDVIIDDGHLSVRCSYSGDGAVWNGRRTLNVLEFEQPIKSTPPQWWWGYEGRIGRVKHALPAVGGGDPPEHLRVTSTTTKYKAGFSRNGGEYRCVPYPEDFPAPEGWIRAEGLTEALFRSFPQMWT